MSVASLPAVATAQSIRTLLRALGTKNDARYNLKIVTDELDEGEPTAARTVADYDDEAEAENDGLAEKTCMPNSCRSR